MAQQPSDILLPVPVPNESAQQPEEAIKTIPASDPQPVAKPEETMSEQPQATGPGEIKDITTATTTPAATEPAPPAKQEDEATPKKPAYLANNPALEQFLARLPTILSSAGHSEMWGVSLKDSTDVPTINVLIKFLRANEGNLKLAEDQLAKSLKWRKSMDPLALAETGRYNAAKFGGLGYLTIYTDSDGKETVTTWNIYGGVKDIDTTFGDVDE